MGYRRGEGKTGTRNYVGINSSVNCSATVTHHVAQDGSAVLAETPAIYGAEHLLTRRAVRPEVGEALIERILWWEDYAARLDGEINNNPTPATRPAASQPSWENR